MKKIRNIAVAFCLVSLNCFSSNSFAGVVKTEGADIIMRNDGGFGVKTADDQFSFNIEGRINLDTSYSTGVLNNATQDKSRTDTYVRRGYLGVTGTAFKDWYFEAIVNGTGDQGGDAHFEWDTLYLKYMGWNFANITVGRAVRPFGLEQSTSSGAISTIERAALWELTNAGDTESSQLIALSNGNQNMSWAASIYDDGNTSSSKSTRYGYDARFTYAPIAEAGHVLHFGVSLDDANIDSSSYKVKSTLGAKKSDGVVFAEGNFKSDRSGVLEAAYLQGPFSVQAEYLRRDQSGIDNTQNADIRSYYLMGTYTLTGESRGYKANAGKFSNITPTGPLGAWELVARYEHVSVEQVVKKTADVYLLGLNWYINKNVKTMLNLQSIATDRVAQENTDKNGRSAAIRLQYNF